MTEQNQLPDATGAVPGLPTRECPFCAEKISINAKKCKHCGETVDVTLRIAEEARRANSGSAGNIVVTTALNTQQAGTPIAGVYFPKSRTTYVVLGVIFGAVGFHNFYAGYSGKGTIQLLLGLTGVGAIVSFPWAIVEMFVVKSDAKGIAFA